MRVALATIYHDPSGRLQAGIERCLPLLGGTFCGLAIRASSAACQGSLDLLAAAGALVERREPDPSGRPPRLGLARRKAVALALREQPDAILYCDADRVLHWAESHPDELVCVVAGLGEADFTVLGRTAQAYASHPRSQRDTEAIVNHLFARVTGWEWDVMAGTRVLSARAAADIVSHCEDDGISTDVSWPLHLRAAGGYTLGYREVEGLEYETADRYSAEVAAAGGQAAWLEELDADLRRWAYRLEMARLHVQAMASGAASGAPS